MKLLPAADSDEYSVRSLGVDDWAWCKGQEYGTILVDLERHCVVDLLSERSTESLAAWLTQHPTVNSISRDHAGTYAEGAQLGAPNAQQIADRFHLILNLSAAIERALEERSRQLQMPRLQTSEVSGWRAPKQLSITARIQKVAPRHAAVLARRAPNQLTHEQRVLFERLSSTCPELKLMRTIALDFRAALSSKDGNQIRDWVQTAIRSGIQSLVRFAFGLRRDISAVTAAVESHLSNG